MLALPLSVFIRVRGLRGMLTVRLLGVPMQLLLCPQHTVSILHYHPQAVNVTHRADIKAAATRQEHNLCARKQEFGQGSLPAVHCKDNVHAMLALTSHGTHSLRVLSGQEFAKVIFRR